MRNLISIFLFIVFLIPAGAVAYNDTKTHPHITENAVKESNLNYYLQNNLGFTKSQDQNKPGTFFKDHYVTELLQKGSELEDDPACRASNHFHNPLSDWDVSGLTDTWWPVNLWCYGFGLGQYPPDEISSNITWATGYLSSGQLLEMMLCGNLTNGIGIVPENIFTHILQEIILVGWKLRPMKTPGTNI